MCIRDRNEIQLKNFIDAVLRDKKTKEVQPYVTKESFLQKFWAAYTYDEIMEGP